MGQREDVSDTVSKRVSPYIPARVQKTGTWLWERSDPQRWLPPTSRNNQQLQRYVEQRWGE